MKIKNYSLIVVIILLLACALPAPASPASTETTPEEVVQQFYRWYLHTLNVNQQPIKQQAMLHKWVTRATIAAINKAVRAGELDADWFLDAQDFRDEWERNIKTSKATVRGNSATLLLTLGGKDWTHKLKITLKREDGDWKIANATSANP